MELGLADKTALVTGGSKGIGLETARALPVTVDPQHAPGRKVDAANERHAAGRLGGAHPGVF